MSTQTKSLNYSEKPRQSNVNNGGQINLLRKILWYRERKWKWKMKLKLHTASSNSVMCNLLCLLWEVQRFLKNNLILLFSTIYLCSKVNKISCDPDQWVSQRVQTTSDKVLIVVISVVQRGLNTNVSFDGISAPEVKHNQARVCVCIGHRALKPPFFFVGYIL